MKKSTFKSFLGKAALFFLVLQLLIPGVFAGDDVLSLYKNKESDNIPFAVGSMLPGDYIQQNYCVRVSYNGTITVHFGIDVLDGYEKLAEVLKCRVVMPDKNLILYDGLMRDLTDKPHEITGVNKTEDLRYEIAVYLDTSVGNRYQNLRLVANFNWWVDVPETPPGGGGGGGGGKPPVDPDDPDKPVDPDDPDKPVDPDDPDKPVDPDDPDKPVDPDDPDKPVDPDDPDKPVNPDGTPKGELIDPPYTGDPINPIILIAIICFALLIIFLIIFTWKKNKKEPNKTIRQLTICIAIIIVLAIALCVTTFALVRSIVTVDNNTFNTGIVKINLNDGNKIIEENEYLFEPGMTVSKEFFVKNESTDSVYYKVYMDNIHGGLKSVLEIKIIDNQTGDVLFWGKPEDYTRDSAEVRELFLNEERMLTAIFYYPEESGNSTKKMALHFDLCADATQMRNNPDKKFD